MIRFSYWCLFISCFYSAQITSAQPVKKIIAKEFIVQGHLPAFKDSTVFIYYVDQLDTVVHKIKISPTGSFTYTASIKGPTKLFLNERGPGVDPWSGEYASDINFWVEPGKTTQIKADIFNKAILAKGNQTQVEQNEFNTINDEAVKAQDGVKKKGAQAKKDGDFTAVKPQLDKMWDSIETSKRNSILKFIKQHPSSYVSLSLIRGYMYYFKFVNRGDELANSFNLLSNSVKSSKTASRTKEFLGLEGDLRIGAKAKNIISRDSSGKEMMLSSLAGKYVLIDFWASWCVPCREEIPALQAIYKKYRDQNFTILSVSLDDDRSKWLNALKQENMPWSNISDLEGFNGLSSKSYNIHAIPYNLLIDPTGKIIAKNLKGTELLDKLNAVTK
ncbi:TlpA family protein disulfide reductase [Mucilaginibacter phyllosphaerae]